MGWGKPAVDSWLETMQNYEENKNRVFDLRVPGVSDYMNALEDGVAKALAGQAKPQKALDAVAKEWNAITKRVGITKVKSAYQNVIALEDNIQ
jgi:multiple sugar transport system substrate-binding protein